MLRKMMIGFFIFILCLGTTSSCAEQKIVTSEVETNVDFESQLYNCLLNFFSYYYAADLDELKLIAEKAIEITAVDDHAASYLLGIIETKQTPTLYFYFINNNQKNLNAKIIPEDLSEALDLFQTAKEEYIDVLYKDLKSEGLRIRNHEFRNNSALLLKLISDLKIDGSYIQDLNLGENENQLNKYIDNLMKATQYLNNAIGQSVS